MLPLRASGTSEPLFCLHPVTGLSWSFAGLAGYVDEDRPIYGIQSPALSEDVEFPASIEEWAALYVDRIRRIQPSGPYHLVGWSLGGSIAHAMAVQLRDMGETVQTLAMLDSHVADPETGVAEYEDPSLADLLGDFAAELAGGDVALRQLDPERVDTILRRLPAPFDRITGADWERIVESIAHSFGLLDRYRRVTSTEICCISAQTWERPTARRAGAIPSVDRSKSYRSRPDTGSCCHRPRSKWSDRHSTGTCVAERTPVAAPSSGGAATGVFTPSTAAGDPSAGDRAGQARVERAPDQEDRTRIVEQSHVRDVRRRATVLDHSLRTDDPGPGPGTTLRAGVTTVSLRDAMTGSRHPARFRGRR